MARVRLFYHYPEKLLGMLYLYSDGLTTVDLGKVYNCDHTTIMNWKTKLGIVQGTPKKYIDEQVKKFFKLDEIVAEVIKVPNGGRNLEWQTRPIKPITPPKFGPIREKNPGFPEYGKERVNLGHSYAGYLKLEEKRIREKKKSMLR